MPDILHETPVGSIYLSPEELPNPSEAVNKFQEVLQTAAIYPPRVIDFPLITADALEEPQKTLTQGCVSRLQELLQGSDHDYLYTVDATTAAELSGLHDIRISRTSIGETSVHQVFFGMLTDGDRKIRVAIKPFSNSAALKSKPEKVMTEWTNMMLARESGLHTFRPLGFILSGNTGYLITERQDDIEPMDNADWSQVMSSPEKHEAMVNDLMKVGPALAHLHDIGCYHEDPQLKNLVLTQRGSVHLIDWEASVFIPQTSWWTDKGVGTEVVMKKTTHDFYKLFGSLARPVKWQGVGLLDGLTPAVQFAEFQRLILSPYLAERLKSIEGLEPDEYMQAYTLLGEIEADVKEYILEGKIYPLERTWHQDRT